MVETIKKGIIYLLLALSAVFFACNIAMLVYAVPVIKRDYIMIYSSTIFSGQFTEKKFGLIKTGMTEKEVLKVIGEPLEIQEISHEGIICKAKSYESYIFYPGNECNEGKACKPEKIAWKYSLPSYRDEDYLEREVNFRRGHVISIDRAYQYF